MMTRKSLHIACMLLFALLPLKMVADTDYACRDAKPIEDGAEINIPAAGEYWYKAGTYDLPIKVHFIPDIPLLAIKPEAIVYFSCYTDNEGNFVYEDPLLDSVINVASEMGKELPYHLTFDVQRDTIEGVPYLVYDLNIPRKYRDQIAAMGLTYEVDAYVKVVVETGGNAAITPDPTTRDCHASCQDLEELPKTLNISSNDTETAYIMPFSVWKKDSIRFIWTGAEDATLWFSADDCGFEPEEGGAYVLGEMQLEIPAGGMLKMTQQEVSNLVDMLKNGGVYYTKVISGAPGELTIEYVPEQAPAEGAKMLTYGTAVEIKPGDETLYYYHDKWGATRFETNNGATVQMFVGNETVGKKKGEYNKAYTYDLLREQGIRYLELSDYEMKALDYSKEQNYIYVRFETTEPVMVTPSKWTPESDCANKSLLIHMGDTLDIPKNDAGKTIYRLCYDEWKNGDMTITRTKGTGTLKMYVGDTCAFTLGTTNKALKYGEDGQYRYLELGPNANRTWDAETLDQWDEYEDKRATDGYYYVRFNVNNVSAVSFTRKERPIQSITITSTDGRKTLDRENPSLTLGAIILPERAKDYPITWQVISGSELIDWDESALTMTAKMNMDGGEVAVVAADATNDQTADTIHIQVAAIPVLVESISLTVDKSELNEEDKVATYSIEVLPADAKDQRVKIVIVEGEDLIFHSENSHTITMMENTSGGTVRVAAIARDASAVRSDTISITIPNTLLVSEVTISGENLLNRAHMTGTYSVSVLPENARNRDYEWTILEGDTLVEYDITGGELTLTAKYGLNGGDVWIVASAQDGSEVADTLRVQVSAIPVLVEAMSISSTLYELSEEQPIALLSVSVVPDNAADKSYQYVILEGSELVTLDAKSESLEMVKGTAGGEVVLYAQANDETGLHSDTISITIPNTLLVSEVTISGESLLNRAHMTETYSVSVLPENARNRDYEWTILEGDTLVEYDITGGELTLTAKYGLNGGDVWIVASAQDGSEVADTLRVQVSAIPVLVEAMSINSTLYELSEEQPIALLSVSVVPDNAADKSYQYVILEGSELVTLDAKSESLEMVKGTAGGEVVLYAQANDETGLHSDTISITIPNTLFVSEVTISGESLLNRAHMTETYSVSVLPENARNRDYEWTILEGDTLVEYDITGGELTLTAKYGLNGGDVWIVASAQDGSEVADTLRVQVSAIPVLVEAMSISSTLYELSEEQPIALLSVSVVPDNAADKSYQYVILEGSELVTLDAESESLEMVKGTAGGEVVLYAQANDETGLHSDTLRVTIANTQPVTEIHINGDTLLNRDLPTSTYSAKVLPENAVNKDVTWAIIEGDSLVEWNDTTLCLTLVKNMDGGKVLLTARATDGSEVSDTIAIAIAAVPVLSEDIVLGTEEGTVELQDTLHLVAHVLPDNAKVQTVTWSIVTGEELVSLTDNVLVLQPGHMADSVVVRAITDDESAIERRMTIYTKAMTAELETIVADIWEQVFQLDDECDSLHLVVRYEPANPVSRDIRIEITEGGHRIAPIERYDIGKGYVIRRAHGADTGDAVVRISSYQDAMLYGEITLHIVASSREGIAETEANVDRRIIMLNGTIYVEINSNGECRRYTLLGERVE